MKACYSYGHLSKSKTIYLTRARFSIWNVRLARSETRIWYTRAFDRRVPIGQSPASPGGGANGRAKKKNKVTAVVARKELRRCDATQQAGDNRRELTRVSAALERARFVRRETPGGTERNASRRETRPPPCLRRAIKLKSAQCRRVAFSASSQSVIRADICATIGTRWYDDLIAVSTWLWTLLITFGWVLD